MKKWIKYSILILTLVFILLPEPVLAVFVSHIIAPFDHLLHGISEKTSIMAAILIVVMLFYLLGLTVLKLASYFLEYFITLQGEWILQLENVTQAGWNFTSGLANMLLVIIFLIIAFAFIFKIETFQAKKALPRLIIVALLINFSLLFVQMLIDVSQILFNTILTSLPEGDFFNAAMNSFIKPLESVVAMIIWLIGALVAAFKIPIASAFAQILFATMFTVLLLPHLIVWIIQMIFFWLLALVFFVFIFLFGARVFVLQILAILSPLAFICLILPQTKSFYSKWFKTLLEWLILGIYFLFFLALGFSVLGLLKPNIPTATAMIPGFGWANIGEITVYCFVLFIYMAVILYVGKKFIPQGAQALIDFGKDIAGTVLTRGLMPVGKGAIAQMRGATVRQRIKEEEEKANATAKGIEYKPSRLRKTEALMSRPIRWGYRYLSGTTPELEENRDVEKRTKMFEERFGKDTESAMEAGLPLGWKITDPSTKTAMALYLGKMYGGGSKGLGQLSDAQLKEAIERTAALAPHKLEDIVKHIPRLINDETAEDKELAKLIQNTLVPKGVARKSDGTFKDKDIEIMASAGIKIDNKEIIDLVENDVEKIKVIRLAAMKKVVNAMKVTDIENLDISTLEDPQFQEMVARFRSDVNFIRRLGEEKGQQYVDKIRTRIEMTDLGAKEIAKTNMNLLKSSVFNPGFKSIFSPITGATNQREIESLEKEIKEEKERLRRRSTATPPPGGGGPTGNTGNIPPRGRQTGGGPT